MIRKRRLVLIRAIIYIVWSNLRCLGPALAPPHRQRVIRARPDANLSIDRILAVFYSPGAVGTDRRISHHECHLFLDLDLVLAPARDCIRFHHRWLPRRRRHLRPDCRPHALKPTPRLRLDRSYLRLYLRRPACLVLLNCPHPPRTAAPSFPSLRLHLASTRTCLCSHR